MKKDHLKLVPPPEETPKDQSDRKIRRERAIALATVVGFLGIVGSSLPIREVKPRFPQGSTPVRLASKDKAEGAIIAANVPNDDLDYVDCGGQRGVALNLFDAYVDQENVPLLGGEKEGSTQIICAKPGSKITEGRLSLG
jgi:hypothetical protein